MIEWVNTNKMDDNCHFIFHNSFIFHLFIVYSNMYQELLQESTYTVITSRCKNWNEVKISLGASWDSDFF